MNIEPSSFYDMGDYTNLKTLSVDLKVTERRRRPEIEFRFHCDPDHFSLCRKLVATYLARSGWYALLYADPVGTLYCYVARKNDVIQSFKSYVSAYGMYPNAAPSTLYVGGCPTPQPST